MAVNNPRFTVNARSPDDQAQAMITEEVLNYQWRTEPLPGRSSACAVDDWLDFGHGWMKVGYKFVTEPKVVKTDDPTTRSRRTEGVDDREAGRRQRRVGTQRAR